MVKISIVIPVYNVKKEYLERCFGSLHAQKYHDLEIIIIDDGSEKECANICDRYASNDNRAIVIHQKNSGAACARNVGITHSSGNYIMFLDSDDWLISAETCSKMAEMTSDSIDIEMFSFTTNQITRMSRYDGVLCNDYGIEDFQSAIIRKEQIAANVQIGAIWSKLFRTDYIKKHNIKFDIGLRRSQDRLFMLECLRYSPTIQYFDYDVMCFNTQNDDSLSRGYRKENREYLEHYYKACSRYVIDNYSQNTRLINDLDYLYVAIFLEICYHVIFHPQNANSIKEKRQDFLQYTNAYFSSFPFTDASLEGLENQEKEIMECIKNGDTKKAYIKLVKTTKITQVKNIVKKWISNNMIKR